MEHVLQQLAFMTLMHRLVSRKYSQATHQGAPKEFVFHYFLIVYAV
jgi:hypothetical protein